MVENWTKARDDLYVAAWNVLVADSSMFSQRKADFIEVLHRFAEGTETMNREYTTRAMDVLGKQIKKRLERAPVSSGDRVASSAR